MDEHLGGCILDGDIGTYAPQVWDRLIELYNPGTFIDIGCGAGHSLKYFIDRNIKGCGVEGHLQAVNHSPVKDSIVLHDYTTGAYVPDIQYDIAWCCEFVEHVEEIFTENFMKTFDYCNIVAMTHGVPGQPGFHHVNCQHAEYWINKFTERGFEYLEDISIELRNLLPVYLYDEFGNVTYTPNGGHVKNTLMIFKK